MRNVGRAARLLGVTGDGNRAARDAAGRFGRVADAARLGRGGIGDRACSARHLLRRCSHLLGTRGELLRSGGDVGGARVQLHDERAKATRHLAEGVGELADLVVGFERQRLAKLSLCHALRLLREFEHAA